MTIAPGPHLYDDPTSRTRMSWIRTILAVIVLGFLLVRGVIVLGAPPALAYLAGAMSILVAATALVRFIMLGRRAPGRLPVTTRRIVVGGVLTLVGVGFVVSLDQLV
jgi:uncharacterized membrane protein YidH (DUF202 family)